MLKETTKEILIIFKKHNFQGLTLEQIQKEILTIEGASIDQRIRRDPEVFNWSGKPKKVNIQPKLPEVVFFKQNNICLRCRNKFPDEKLVVSHLNLGIDDVDNYNNLTAMCLDCAKIIDSVLDLTTIPIDPTELEQYDGTKWEYKRVIVKKEEIHQKGAIESRFYFVFQEDRDDPREWRHIAKGDNLQSVLNTNIQDIMNFYGKQGWEFAQYIPFHPKTDELDENLFSGPYSRETILIFKREP